MQSKLLCFLQNPYRKTRIKQQQHHKSEVGVYIQVHNILPVDDAAGDNCGTHNSAARLSNLIIRRKRTRSPLHCLNLMLGSY